MVAHCCSVFTELEAIRALLLAAALSEDSPSELKLTTCLARSGRRKARPPKATTPVRSFTPRHHVPSSRLSHSERAQPLKRQRLGLLEKHADYVKRARDFHSKEDRIKKLREKAAGRNKDEFYFGMIRSRTVVRSSLLAGAVAGRGGELINCAIGRKEFMFRAGGTRACPMISSRC